MKRIDTPDKDTDLFGSGKHGYKDGTPPGASPTSLNAAQFNHHQEELARVVEDLGPLDATQFDQVLGAIKFWTNAQPLMNWTQQTSTAFDSECIASTDIDGTDTVVVMQTGTNGERSTDGGLTWAAVTGQSQSTREMAYGNSLFIAVGGGSINIQSSPTGVTWTSEDTGTGTGNDVIYDVALALWCVVGADTGPWIVTSADGLAWTVRTGVGSDDLNGIASNGTIFVAVGDNGQIQTATDATGTWTARTADASYSGDFQDVVWTGKVFVAVGTAGEAQTSLDGITWVSHVIDGAVTNNHVWNLQGVIVVGGGGVRMYLNHGICAGTWLVAPQHGNINPTDAPQGMTMSVGKGVACSTTEIYTSHTLVP